MEYYMTKNINKLARLTLQGNERAYRQLLKQYGKTKTTKILHAYAVSGWQTWTL